MTPEWKKLERKVKKLLDNKVEIEHITGSHGIHFETEFFDAESLFPLASEIAMIHVSPRSNWKDRTWLSVSIWPKRRLNEQ